MILQDNNSLSLFMFSGEGWKEKCGSQRPVGCSREGRALERISAGPLTGPRAGPRRDCSLARAGGPAGPCSCVLLMISKFEFRCQVNMGRKQTLAIPGLFCLCILDDLTFQHQT